MLKSSVHALSREDMDLIHRGAVEILRDIGVRVDHPRMLSLLSDFGCRVEGSVARFPEAITEDVVGRMRDPRNLLDGYVGTLPLRRDRVTGSARVVGVATGQATMALDLETDELRPATQRDLADACRVVTSLPGALTAHPVFLPQDAPEAVRDLYALRVVAEHYPYSDFVEVFSPEAVPYFLEMGRVIRGSDERLKADPPFSAWVFATPPLQFGKHGFDIVFALKDFGLQQGYGMGGVMPILGASTPLTLSGYLVMQTAEILACNVMNWALLGRVAGYTGGPAIMDMSSGAPSQSAPEAVLLELASMDLQRYYGDPDPLFPFALGADAKSPDVQDGIDKTLSATVAVLAGSRFLSAGMGALSLSGVASLAQLVIDYELCRTLEHLVRGFEVDDEHIGLETIKRVGIGGSFLTEPHTLAHMRETLFFPRLFDRRMVGQWQADRRGMLEHAKDRVREILSRGEPAEYLSREQVRELDRIARRARADLG